MIQLFKPNIPKNIGKKLQDVFDSGIITEGEYTEKFEEQFSYYINNKNTGVVNSGTSALTLAYICAGIGPGDEVITTPMTCMATNEPIHNLGAKIVWADIDPRTGNIDPSDVIKKITKKTKAIVGVHWGGMPFQIDEINKIALENNLKVIEDAAHALGAEFNGTKIGSHSDYVCFSFQAIKHLTTVDGGAISCRTTEELSKIKRLRWFGLDRSYKGSKWTQDIKESGYKFHMNNINACIGIEQMKTIDSIILAHKNNYKYYNLNIDNKKITKMREDKDKSTSSWIYTILTENKYELQKFLQEKGIASDPVHIRNDKYSVFKQYLVDEKTLPGLNEFDNKHLNIPVGWWLTEKELKYIVDCINAY